MAGCSDKHARGGIVYIHNERLYSQEAKLNNGDMCDKSTKYGMHVAWLYLLSLEGARKPNMPETAIKRRNTKWPIFIIGNLISPNVIVII